MKIKRWFFAGLAAFIILFLFDALFMAGLFSVPKNKPDYALNYTLAATSHVLYSFILTWFYTLNYQPEKNGFRQGLRFGIYAGLLVTAHLNLILLPAVPYLMPLLGGIVVSFVPTMAAGILIGMIYRNP